MVTYFILIKTCENGKTDIGSILTHNFWTFVCVGLIEVYFFFTIASKYIPIKPSYVSEVALSELESKI